MEPITHSLKGRQYLLVGILDLGKKKKSEARVNKPFV
jgi:hypothetical protein